MISTRLAKPVLHLRSNVAAPSASTPSAPRSTAHCRDVVLCWGGQGKRCGLRLKFILRAMQIESVAVVAIDGDAYDWQTLAIAGYDAIAFAGGEFVVLGAEKTRDQIRADPFLRARFDRGGLWRGVPVSETFQRGGRGGLSYPTFAAAFYESERERALATIHQWLAPLVTPKAATRGSDLKKLLDERKANANAVYAKPRRIVNLGSGVGSWGWTGHSLGAYDVRLALNALGIVNYELWGIVFGPNLYKGLTPNIHANWHALMDQLRHLARHGLHRKYGGHGADVDIDAPPYDPGRMFLVDQARGPHNGRRASEEELEAFQWNVALSLALLLTSDAGDQLVSYSANPAEDAFDRPERHGEEIFGTLGSALAGVDTEGMRQYFAAKSRVELLSKLQEQI